MDERETRAPSRARRLTRGILVGTITGLALAPAIAGVIGTTAGLAGAAATAHGLAVLGGGSLATGGAGMMGGYLASGAAGAITMSSLDEVVAAYRDRRSR